MSVTIVIPAKNEEKNLGKLLSDIKKQTLQPKAVIVADAKSTDKTRAIAKKYGCKVVPGGLPGVGRNRGARGAKTDYLLFLDADVRLPDTTFIETSITQMQKRKLDAATVNNLPGWTGEENALQRTWLRFMHFVTNATIRTISLSSAAAIGTCIFFRTEAFHKLKGFDESILWEEDTELVQRARNKGYSFAMLYTSIVASTRRIIDQGYFRFYYNVIKLFVYRLFNGEITSWKTYKKVTGREDYFTFLRFRA
jgi:glycosyltransferase involved in cell wall biosynthesis